MQRELGERLKEALEDHAPQEIRGDKQAFQRALRDRMGSDDPRQGTSYPAVLGYFSGNTTPSLHWIGEAAALLGVRAPWLAFDDGEPTEEEERERVKVSTISSEATDHAERSGGEIRPKSVRLDIDGWAIRLKVEVLQGLGALGPDFSGVPTEVVPFWAKLMGAGAAHIPHWVAPVAELRRRLGRDAATIGQALASPLKAFGIDPMSGVDSSYRTLPWLDDWITAMVPVLLSLAPQLNQKED